MATTVRDASTDDAGAMAELLATRHRRHLAVQPLLRPHVDCAELLRDDGGARTWVATDGDDVVGFLRASTTRSALGDHVQVAAVGHAAADGATLAPLVAVAASHFVGEGERDFYAFVPAVPSSLQPWFDLGFGTSAFQAATRVDPAFEAGSSSVAVRLGEPSDLAVAARLNRAMDLHLHESPSFGQVDVGTQADYEEEWADTWSGDQYVHLVAELDGRVVGSALLYRRPPVDLRVPVSSIDLAQAFVEPSMRGLGVSRALVAAAHRVAAEQEIDVLITDWRAGNLPATTVWPALGFTETFRRLYRHVPMGARRAGLS